MATNGSAKADAPAPAAPPVEPELTVESIGADVWGEILSSLEGTRDFIFCKGAKTRVRLIGIGKDPRTYFREVPSTFRGRTRSKFIVLGFAVAGKDSDEVPALKAVVLPKTALKAIGGLQQEGYDLFGPNGRGCTIIKSGSEQQTSYSVSPSPKPVAVPANIKEELETKGLDYFYQVWVKRESERSNSNGEAEGAEAEGNDW